MIGDPPSTRGALHVTVACVFPAVAETLVGAPGIVIGVTAVEADDTTLVPTALVAVTVNVYAVPLVSPVTLAASVPLDQLAVCPPGLAVTMYPVINDPPVDAGALHVTVACVFPAVADTLVGAPGVVAGVTAFDPLDVAPTPTVLIVVTTNV